MTGGMMFKGTPGPWEHNARTGEFGPTNKYSPVGLIYGGDENGFLVAAAPELLEAMPDLSHVIAWLENGCAPDAAAKELRIYQAKINAAIAKALGEHK